MSRSALLNVKDVAAQLNVDRKTILNMVRNQEIAHIKFGSRILRFEQDDVNAFIEEHKTCRSIEKAKSGTTTSTTKSGAITVRRGKRANDEQKPWSERSDLKPQPALVQMPEK